MRRFLLFLVVAMAIGAASAQQRPAITGIAFARMYAADPAASDAFYKMLGLAPEGGSSNVKRYEVSPVQWVEVMPLPTPAPMARLAAVGFTTRNAAGMERYLKAHGVRVVEPLRGGQFMVLDPEGNRIAFVQTGPREVATKRPAGVGAETSRRIIHVGFHVDSQSAEDNFYKDLLGFQAYWHGGMKDGTTDWVSLQVPEGSDWLEYMLSPATRPDPQQQLHELGVQDHFSLGTDHMQQVVDALAKNGCAATPQAANCAKTQMGKDGKVQLNVFDPDLTRVEYMEFKTSGPVCCSKIEGKTPTAIEDK